MKIRDLVFFRFDGTKFEGCKISLPFFDHETMPTKNKSVFMVFLENGCTLQKDILRTPFFFRATLEISPSAGFFPFVSDAFFVFLSCMIMEPFPLNGPSFRFWPKFPLNGPKFPCNMPKWTLERANFRLTFGLAGFSQKNSSGRKQRRQHSKKCLSPAQPTKKHCEDHVRRWSQKCPKQ